LADKVTVAIHAEAESGFHKAKLQKGVMEPLREADLIEQHTHVISSVPEEHAML